MGQGTFMTDESLEYLENLRTNLKSLREYRRISMRNLAKKVGRSHSYLGKIEDPNNPRFPSIRKIS